MTNRSVERLEGARYGLEGGIFDYDTKKKELEEEELVTVQPDFWNDPEKAEATLKAIRSKKAWTDQFEQVTTAS